MSRFFHVSAKVFCALLLIAILFNMVMVLLDARDATREMAAAAAAPAVPASSPKVSLPERAAESAQQPAPEPDAAAAPEPTPEPSPEPTPEPTPQVFTVSMVGDCTLASYPEIRNFPSSFENTIGDNWAQPFSRTVSYFEQDDFTITNLECTLSDNQGWSASTFSFLAPSAAVEVLKSGSVEYVTTANNHAMDFGQDRYNDTCAVLDAASIGHSGDGEYSLYTTESGVKVGVYSVFNYYAPAVAKMSESIAALRAEGAEIVIVATHWGIEGNYYQTGDQITVGHNAIDAGADIVFGSHPHRLQPMEVYGNGIIFYSMGNWIFAGNTNPDDKDSAIAQVRFQRDENNVLRLLDYSLIPCSISGQTSVNDYCPTPYAEGSEEYARAYAKISGEYTGPNSQIDYSFMHPEEG